MQHLPSALPIASKQVLASKHVSGVLSKRYGWVVAALMASSGLAGNANAAAGPCLYDYTNYHSTGCTPCGYATTQGCGVAPPVNSAICPDPHHPSPHNGSCCVLACWDAGDCYSGPRYSWQISNVNAGAVCIPQGVIPNTPAPTYSPTPAPSTPAPTASPAPTTALPPWTSAPSPSGTPMSSAPGASPKGGTSIYPTAAPTPLPTGNPGSKLNDGLCNGVNC